MDDERKQYKLIKRSRPNVCPRLLTLPVGDGKCPLGYLDFPSKLKKGETCCKRKVLIPLKRGTLTKFGYSTSNKTKDRNVALLAAMDHYGWLTVFRKLNAVMIYNKNKPKWYNIYKRDRDWVKKQGKALEPKPTDKKKKKLVVIKKEKSNY